MNESPRGVRRADPGVNRTPDISDVRRLRRQSGVSLRRIADRTGIPLSLLRELEWGYFDNWPSGAYAETCLAAYAREAGLDQGLVISIVDPYLSAAKRRAPDLAADGRGAETIPAGLPGGRRARPAVVVAAGGLLVALAASLAWWSGGAVPERTREERAERTADERPGVRAASGKADEVPSDPDAEGRSRSGAPAPIDREDPEDAQPKAGEAPSPQSDAGSIGRPAAAGDGARPPAPLERLGRIIAGDGRYPVRPFPSPDGAHEARQ